MVSFNGRLPKITPLSSRLKKVVSSHALNMGDWILFRLAKPEPQDFAASALSFKTPWVDVVLACSGIFFGVYSVDATRSTMRFHNAKDRPESQSLAKTVVNCFSAHLLILFVSLFYHENDDV
jgi:hypothetical protein